MKCPRCAKLDMAVTNSRPTAEHQSVRRRRSCTACGHRLTTIEVEVVALATSETEGPHGLAVAVRRGRELVDAFASLSEADAKTVMHLVRRLGMAPAEAEDVAA